MSETPEQIADALEAYSAWCGGVHDEGCPEDDTCDCSGKRLNDGVTAAVNHLRACGSCFSVVDAIRRAEKAESLLASREEENRDQVALIHKLVHERDEAEATMSTLRDQVGRLRELVEQWRAESKRWREDDSTPYACEWADTLDECAADLESRMDKPT